MRAALRILAMLAGLGLILFAFVPPTPTGTLPPDLQNGVWLDRHWLRGTRTSGEMESLLRDMHEARVRYLFVHAGPYAPDGTIPPFSPERVALLR